MTGRLGIILGIVAVVGATLAVVSPATAAGDEPAIHFVVDVSGSMGGQKLTEAVDAINTTVEAIPDTTALGLRSYAGSCSQSSVPVLVPIGIDNDAQVVAATNGLSAGGGTPTTAALDVGIDELLAYPSAGTKRLVLLTDGDTQCGISVCDFIKQKDLGGLELTLYTVGLQVSSVAAADLQCAAEYTGGTYIPAEDPTDLADALGEATGGLADVDGDGLPDTWEDNGRDLGNGLFDYTLRDAGASSDHKDVFLRIDAEKKARLSDEAIAMVVDAFANSPVSNPDGTTGVRLHIKHGPEISIADSDALRQSAGENAGYPDWDKIMERLGPFERNYYRYAVAVRWEDWRTSGMADGIPGQLMVLNWGDKGKSAAGFEWVLPWNWKKANSDPYRAATLMHELGHTLGLHHGGAAPLDNAECTDADGKAIYGPCDIEDPYKPNYLSVMNYSFQGNGGIPGWGVDYSRWGSDDLYVLDEASLSEFDGVLSPNGSVPDRIKTFYYCPDGTQEKVSVNKPIDWNCSTKGRGNGIESGRISANIDYPKWAHNDDPLQQHPLAELLILSPFDDWAWIDQNSSEALGSGLIGENSDLYGGGGYYA